LVDRFVVDNSVVMAWCFEDEDGDYASGILERLVDGEALVPGVWPLEVANVLLVAERNRRLGEADSTRFVSLLSQLPIVVETEAPQRVMAEILALAREHKLSSYDASYLDLAMRSGLPIATLDSSLKRAASKCQVTLIGE